MIDDYMIEPIEDEPLCFCDVCNGDLYEGDEIFKIEGDNICKGGDCLEEHFSYAKHTVEKGDL